MNSTFRAFVWKEWHELRWKLAFGAVLSWGLAIIGFHTRVVPDISVLTVAVLVAAGLLPVFAAMDVIALERAENTFQTLIALPIGRGSLWRWKLLVHIPVFLVPVLGVMLIALALAGNRELQAWQIQALGGAAIGSSIMIYLWTLCLSVDQPTEARVGLLGAAVYVLWILVPLLGQLVQPGIENHMWSACPWGWLQLLEAPQWFPRIVLWQTGFAIAMIAWGQWRFARLGKGGRT